jgi:outer membrane protein assembly factor BamB
LNDAIFLATNRRVHCIDARTGMALWTHVYPLHLDAVASDVCRWDDLVVVATDGHVLAIHATTGSGHFITTLPPPFDRRVPLRLIARGDRLVVHDPVVIAGLSRSGRIEWSQPFAQSYQPFMPSVLWGNVARGGLERTFDRR